uniref:trans-L-3-hydroxyproline dehydratase n=1 Tax=Sinocyclocheilus rhinocerous TaxID=307959 RepID=A0A673MDB0_9TELE
MEFPKLPLHSGSVLSVVDMHTGGEQLRIILSGYPEVKGDTILAKRRYVREHLDHLRKVLMFEPRGHYDMYGALLVRSELAEADLGVLFMHNEGYSTMCGHAVIALGRFAVDYGLIKTPTSPETQINIHCPCGLVKAFTQYSNGKTGAVRFHSVPAFVVSLWNIYYIFKLFLMNHLPYLFYIYFYNIIFNNVVCTLYHPVSEDLAFLYGTILTDGLVFCSSVYVTEVCYMGCQVDRSPTGSGVTARIALQYHKGLIGLNQTRSFKSGATGSVFTGKAIEETTCGDFRAVVVEVTGHAHYSGVASFIQESDDPQSGGFLLR